MSATLIPFNRPSLVGSEQQYMRDALHDGHVAGDGRFTALCQQLLAREIGCHSVLLTTSCTHALELAALLLNLEDGDEVIVPSFTFVSAVNAFVLRGATPVFSDVRPDTLNLDETRLEDLITDRTRAIVPVHYAGVACEMDRICEIAAKRGISIIEDNAHGLLGGYRGKPLGSFGPLATLSFHETKNFMCGEGGALVLDDPVFRDRAEVIRQKGTNRTQFFRGQVDKYGWVDVGSSYVLSDLLAAFLYAQLEAHEQVQRKRRAIWEFYNLHLMRWATDHGVTLPTIPSHCAQAYHMFYLILPSLEHRQALIAHLKRHRIQSVFHYVPLHLSLMGQRFGGRQGDCPVTEAVSDRLLRLPFYNDLSESELERIVAATTSFPGC